MPKSGPELGFCHFLKFDLLVSLDITYNDSLRSNLTSSRNKIHKKNFGAQIRAKGAKLGPKLGFLPFW